MSNVVYGEFDWDRVERRSVPELWTPDEIFEGTTWESLPRFCEDHRIERKPAGIHAEPLAVYVCMWANTPPDGGLVVIGVDDDGSVSGCSARSTELTDIERRVRNDLCPDAHFTAKRIFAPRSDGNPDFVLMLRVSYRSDKVVETNKGDAWIRRVDSKHLLTQDERRELEIERGQVSFELEPCGLKYPDDFDMPTMRSWATNVRKFKNLKADVPLGQMLVNHHLGRMQRGDFVPNNACALLFAVDPQNVVEGCMIRFQRIEGDHTATGKDRNVVRDVRITGPLPRMISDAADAIESQIRTYSRLGDKGKFYTAPEYPFEAWYELIVNACVHRSYSLKRMNIFVRMFDDHFVVESPGPFPPLVTADNIYEVHHRRNWWLMDAMFYLDLVKCENEGAKRIRKAMQQMDLPEPEFEQKQVAGAVVRVTLRNNQNVRRKWVDADVSTIVGQALASTLTEHETRIINFVAEHGKINVSEAMRLTARPRWHTAEARLKKLRKKGLLRHVQRYPRDPKSHYVLVQPTQSTDEP